MPDHAYYEELAALAAGGHLSSEEANELRVHLGSCAICRHDLEVYGDVVCSGLPLLRDQTAAEAEHATHAPDAHARDRFLTRARREGLQFSEEVEPTARVHARPFFSVRAVAGLALAATVVLGVLYGLGIGSWNRSTTARSEIERLRQENAQLTERVTTREREVAAAQEQVRALRAQLDAQDKTLTALRRDNEQKGVQLGRSTSQAANLADELQNRDRNLASITDEINRLAQLRSTDRATLGVQEAKLKSLRDQLRVASATLDMERQLADAGRDLLELLRAKQLQVIDVRDTDANGRPGAAFARVFVAEGKSIRIFAFDLDGRNGAARRFQVWGATAGDPGAVRSLGSLDLDDRTQNRWSLTVQNESVIKDIDAVFVTASARANAPDGPRLLYTSVAR